MVCTDKKTEDTEIMRHIQSRPTTTADWQKVVQGDI